MRKVFSLVAFIVFSFSIHAQAILFPSKIKFPSSVNVPDGVVELQVLNGGGQGFNYNWDDGSTLPNRNDLLGSDMGTPLYQVTATPQGGGTALSLSIAIYNPPVLQVNQNTNTCTLKSLEFQDTSNSGGTSNYFPYTRKLKIIYPDGSDSLISFPAGTLNKTFDYGGNYQFSIVILSDAVSGQVVSESNVVYITLVGSYPVFKSSITDTVCLSDMFYMELCCAQNVNWDMDNNGTYDHSNTNWTDHTYTSSPTSGSSYLVNVTFQEEGCTFTHTMQRTIYIGMANNPIQLDYIFPPEPCAGDNVQFSLTKTPSFNTSWSDLSGHILRYDNSDYDDHIDVIAQTKPEVNSSDTLKVSVYYCTNQTPVNAQATIPLVNNAAINPNFYDYWAIADSICVGGTASFKAADYIFNNYQYIWHFPDGSVDTGQFVYNTFNQSGIVNLEVKNNCGMQDWHSIPIQVFNSLPINTQDDTAQYQFQVSANQVCQNDLFTIQFLNVGDHYEIDFGPGTPPITIYSNDPIVRFTHAYTIAGIYTITATMYDACGASSQITRSITVGSTNPSTNFGKDIFWMQGSLFTYPSPLSGAVNTCEPTTLFSPVPGTQYRWVIDHDTFVTTTPFLQYVFPENLQGEKIFLKVQNGCTNNENFEAWVDLAPGNCSALNLFTNYLQQPTCTNPRGSFVVSASGGTPPYAYEWNLNQSTIQDTITNVLPGIYRVTVTDSLGAKGILDVEIKNPINTLQLSTTVQSPSNCHLTDGSAEVAVAGGVGPYTYRWSTGLQTDALHENIAAGTYAVTVTDAQSCSRFAMLQVRDAVNTPSIINSQLTPPSCYGAKDGSIQVNCPPGGGYQYYWSNGDQDAHNQNLGAGTYYLQITNSLGCVLTEYFTLSQPEPLKVKVDNMVSPNPCGSNTGQVFLSIQGGTAPYSNYSWSDTPGSFTNTRTDLIAQAYTVTVTDANNCQDTISVYVDELPLDIVKTDQKLASCNQSDGIVSLQIVKQPGFDSDFTSLTGELLGSGQSPWIYNAVISEKFTAQAAGIKLVKASATQLATNNTCVTYRRHVLPTAPPDTQQLCLVTVNDSNQNVCVFEQSTDSNIAHYILYREDFISGMYNEIHLSDTQQTEWTDKGADAGLKSHRYRVAVENNCGVRSEWSDWHRAAHSNVYVSADQDSLYLRYESYAGFALDSIYILADTTGVMPYTWFVLDKMSYVPGTQVYGLSISGAGLNSAYTQNKLLLAVDFPKDQACSGVKANNRNSTRSNTDKGRPEALTFFAQAQTTGSTGPCDGTAQINVFGGTPPYSYNWGAGYVTGDAFRSSLCMGPYQVTVIDANNNQRIVPFTIGALVGMPEPIQNTGLMIYPNPSQDKVWIESTQDPLQEVSIYSVSGALVYQTKVLDNSLHVISLHHWPAGLYQVHAQVGDRIRVLKLLKQ